MNTMKFKLWLVENKITQTKVAELLELTPQAVNLKINGQSEFSITQIAKICKAYNISADEMFINTD